MVMYFLWTKSLLLKSFVLYFFYRKKSLPPWKLCALNLEALLIKYVIFIAVPWF